VLSIDVSRLVVGLLLDKDKWSSNLSVQRFNRSLRSLLRCSMKHCTVRTRLHFAHIGLSPIIPNGKGRGQNHRVLDLKNHPEAYLPFCSSHHRIVDSISSVIPSSYLLLGWKLDKTLIMDLDKVQVYYNLQSPLRSSN